jgi:lysophospholipase L1-like esterase
MPGPKNYIAGTSLTTINNVMERTSACFLIVLCISAVQPVQAQQPPFYKEIQEFKKQDSLSYPPKNAILLVGSSSFTKWTDVQTYFPNHTIINRGFGGSSLPDVIRYANDIIIPYRPKQVIVYCGDNDLASSDTVTAQMVVNRFKNLFQLIRKSLPSTNITFVSIKPSPSRARLMPKMKKVNATVQSFLSKQKNVAFINVFRPMLLPDGKPKPELFVADSLHMNGKGYAIWQKAMEPYLK